MELQTGNVTVEQAIDFIRENNNKGEELDINGDVFFGMNDIYCWSDVAQKAGLSPNPIIPGIHVKNTAFHHFRNENELRVCLEHIKKEHGILRIS